MEPSATRGPISPERPANPPDLATPATPEPKEQTATARGRAAEEEEEERTASRGEQGVWVVGTSGSGRGLHCMRRSIWSSRPPWGLLILLAAGGASRAPNPRSRRGVGGRARVWRRRRRGGGQKVWKGARDGGYIIEIWRLVAIGRGEGGRERRRRPLPRWGHGCFGDSNLLLFFFFFLA